MPVCATLSTDFSRGAADDDDDIDGLPCERGACGTGESAGTAAEAAAAAAAASLWRIWDWPPTDDDLRDDDAVLAATRAR